MPRSRTDDDSDDRDGDERPRRRGRRDDRQDNDSVEDERPKGRRKGGGVPVWGWAVIGGVVLVAVGVVVWVVLNGRGGATGKENATVIESGKEHRVGDVGITVTGCKEEPVSGSSPSGNAIVSNDVYTTITISIKNYNGGKNARVGAQTGSATVTDDLGNTLLDTPIDDATGFRCRIDGQIRERHQIELRSDETGSDKLVVSRTVPSAKTVTVLIDASMYNDGRGWLKVTIPIGNKIVNKPKLDFDTVKTKVMGKTLSEVRKEYGQPDSEDNSGSPVVYNFLVWDAKKQKHAGLQIEFGSKEDGRVARAVKLINR